MADDNHTPIDHLIPQSTSASLPSNKKPLPPKNTSQQAVQSAQYGGKESEPIIPPAKEEMTSQEKSKDSEKQNENSSEKNQVQPVKQIPHISRESEKAGLAVAPSAKPFPTIYDIKVPIYTDEQIEQNLHKSFWTGARWLAELCKYLLWQSHIKLKKIGKKVIRQAA